jgi:hypothetical protein
MPYHDFPGTAISPHRIFRQAVALVGNGCSGKETPLTRTVDLKTGSTEVLFNGGGKVLPITGNEYVFDLQFSDPGVKELHSTIWYVNGMRERLQLRFKQYVDNKGRFVAELRNDRPDYAQATFMGATIELPAPPAKPLSVTAKMCTNDVSLTAANAKRGTAVAKPAATKPAEAPVGAMEATPKAATPTKPAAVAKPTPPPTPKKSTASAAPKKPAVSTGGRKPAVTYSTEKSEPSLSAPVLDPSSPAQKPEPPKPEPKKAAPEPAKAMPKSEPTKAAPKAAAPKPAAKSATPTAKKPAPKKKEKKKWAREDEKGADWTITEPR